MKLIDIKVNYYFVFLLVLTILMRVFYHTNSPFFEDEGLFLLDSSKNVFQVYSDTLYMKPYVGVAYYSLIYNLFGVDSFLWLHISTTLFILTSNIFIFLIVKKKTENDLASLLSGLLFLTFTNLSIGGYAHSSLEHLQLPFLLASYYFLFVTQKNTFGLILLSLPIMIKQNVALLLLPITNIIIKNWKISMVIFLFWLIFSLLLFDNFIFNTLIFPSQFYETYGLKYKIYATYNSFLKAGYGFNLLIVFFFFLSIFEFYKKYRSEFLFILLLGLSLLSTPLYPQHFVVIVPFLIIVSSLLINKVINKYRFLVMGVLLLLLLNILKVNKNYEHTKNKYFLTGTQTKNHRLNGNSNGLKDFYFYLKHLKGEKVYIYPVLVPHFYILNDLRTIDSYFSNDHFNIIMKNKFLRDKLLKSIKKSSPKYLIKMKDSDLDLYIKELLSKKYKLYKHFSNIKIYKRKTSQ